MSDGIAAIAAMLAKVKASVEQEDDGVDRSIERCKALVEKLNEHHAFRAGDLVQWKPGLKSTTLPEYGEPMLVVEALEAPVTDGVANTGSPYFRQPLDLVCARIDLDGDLVMYHFDSRRLEPYQPTN